MNDDIANDICAERDVKAKFHYARWLEAGSKLVTDLLATKFY